MYPKKWSRLPLIREETEGWLIVSQKVTNKIACMWHVQKQQYQFDCDLSYGDDLLYCEFMCCIVADSCYHFLSRNMASSSAQVENSAHWAAEGEDNGFTRSFPLRVCFFLFILLLFHYCGIVLKSTGSESWREGSQHPIPQESVPEKDEDGRWFSLACQYFESLWYCDAVGYVTRRASRL